MLDIFHPATFATRREAYATAFDGGVGVGGLKFFRDGSSRLWGWEPAVSAPAIEIEAEAVDAANGPVDVVEIEIEADGTMDNGEAETPEPRESVGVVPEPVSETPERERANVTAEIAEDLVYAARDKLVTIAILSPGHWDAARWAEEIARKMKTNAAAIGPDGRPAGVFGSRRQSKPQTPRAPRPVGSSGNSRLAARDEAILALLARDCGASLDECFAVSGRSRPMWHKHMVNITKRHGLPLRVDGNRYFTTLQAAAA